MAARHAVHDPDQRQLPPGQRDRLSPALLLAANNAPGVFNIFQSHRFIFENDWDFRERYDMTDDFFKAKSDLEMEPVRGRAAIRSNVFPDIVNAELPLDNQRAPGYRRIQPTFTGFIQDGGTGGFISQYPSGRYSKAHYQPSGAVLVCLRGKGYTYNWPVDLGPTPWQDGKGDQVRVLEYVPGGLVAAAPGGGNWFHQHFGVGKRPAARHQLLGRPALALGHRRRARRRRQSRQPVRHPRGRPDHPLPRGGPVHSHTSTAADWRRRASNSPMPDSAFQPSSPATTAAE